MQSIFERFGRLSIATLSIMVLFFLAAPLIIVVAISFTTTAYLAFPPIGFTWRWYAAVFNDPTFVEAFLVSSELAAAATLLALLLGIPSSLVIARRDFWGRDALSAFFLSPLVLPTIVLGAAILQYAVALGFARTFPALLVGHVILITPYILRTTLASLVGMEATLEEAAQDLGATPLKTFFLVTLPQIKPAVMAGSLFAFINSWINVEVSIFNSTARFETIPVKLFNYIQFNIDPRLAAVSAVTIYFAIFLVLVIDFVFGVEKVANTTDTRAGA